MHIQTHADTHTLQFTHFSMLHTHCCVCNALLFTVLHVNVLQIIITQTAGNITTCVAGKQLIVAACDAALYLRDAMRTLLY
jgi:hypothetical protein